jgi:hypothetical protein
MTELNELFIYSFPYTDVTFSQYIERTKKFMHLTEEDFCMVAVILEYICEKYKNIDPLTYYSLYACALVVCIKMYNDNVKTNKFFSYIFGISLNTLNSLELKFLEMIDWNINITIDQFNKNVEWLMKNDHNYVKMIENIFLKNIENRIVK